MNSYPKYIKRRLQPLVNEGDLLWKFTEQASSMYEQAEDLSSDKYDSKMVFNAYPLDRYLLANEVLYELALNYDDAEVKQKSNGYGNYHTEVRIHDILLTISQVKHSGELVRSSIFRQNFADRFNGTLFDPIPATPLHDELIYAIILHGPISSNIRTLGFLNIAIPDVGLTGYGFNQSLYNLCDLKQPFELESRQIEKQEQQEAPTISLK